MSEELRVITDFLKDEKAKRSDSKEPLEKPEILDDPAGDVNLKAAAGRWYAGELLKRKTLSEIEGKYLLSEITKHLRGE